MKIFILLALVSFNVNAKNKESWYQNKYCKGLKEFRLPDNTRIDCLEGSFAIEYDWGHKWAECAGQAQYYGRVKKKIAGCVLINAKPRFLKRLLKSFDGAVWVATDKEVTRIR